MLRRLGLDIFFSYIFVSVCLCIMEAQAILKLVESLAVYDGKSDVSEFIKKTKIISKIIEWESLKFCLDFKLSVDAFQFWTSAPFETLEDFKSAFLLRFARTTKYRELKYSKFELKPNQSVVEYASLVKQGCQEKLGNNFNPSIVIHDLVNGLPDTYAKLLQKPTTYAFALVTLSHAEDVQTALRLRKSGGGLEAVNAVGSTNYQDWHNSNRWGNFRQGYEARQLPKSGAGNSFNGQNSGNSSNAATQSRNFYTKDRKSICNKCLLSEHIRKNYRLSEVRNLIASGRI
ncbi:hypothetical protein QYM36_002970 [Artemia franciscana]|uniref:Retrotransposon gag domain-containing protein n=1 Tax=Artemia franciscana TaxID=6661 RepID=A0AA88I758_ARTSF|nr:hypothetical protein QYM36_002970 [Artemia franciscana]